jgi:putative methionine-R-sulfoxide reductase with GAF domain
MNMTSIAEAKLVEDMRFGFWGNLPLSRKLLLAFGMLSVFGLVIAGLGVWGLNRVQSAYENALAGGVEIQALSDHLNSEQLEARRREKDFLLRWQTEGYDTAYENYVVTNQEHTVEMKTTLNKLNALAPSLSRVHLDQFSQEQFEADIAALNEAVLTYEKSFALAVRLLGERGFVDTGLEGELRTSVHAIEEKMLGVEDQLTITMLQIRRHEKDYLLRGDQQYVDNVHEQVAQLKNQTASSDTLTFSEQVEIRALADQYLVQFDGLVAKDREAADAIEVFRAAAADIQTIAERLALAGAQLAAQDVETAQTNSTRTFTLTAVTALLVLVLSIVLALVLSRQITLPVLQLTNTARAIAAGTFDVQAQVSSGDEVGTLAQTFNTMTKRLGEAFEDVRRRAAELATVAEVSTATSTILESKRLLQEVVDLTKERFHLYHSHIYLLDENGDNLVLTAGAGEPGRFMVAEGRSIPLDREQSLVARAAREHKGVTVNDVTMAPDFLPNPLLPDTRSELAVPMIVGGSVIGVFDIQSEQVGRFTDSDVNIQTTLAAQLATSIQNVRSFEQSRKQAELESLVNVIGQKIQRTTSIEETLQTAIRELGTAIGASRVKANISVQNDGIHS